MVLDKYYHGLGFGVRFVDLNEEQLEKLLVLLKIAETLVVRNPDLRRFGCRVREERRKKMFLNQVVYRMYSVWSVEEFVQ